MSTDFSPKSPSQVSSAAPSRSVVFGGTQRQPRGNIRFASSSGAIQNRVAFGQREMGNSSSQQRHVPMMRPESEIPHKSTEDQIDDRSRNRNFPSHQSVISLPFNHPDIISSNASSINIPAKNPKSIPNTISKTHRKIVSLGGLSKNTHASSTTNGVPIQQLSSATISGTGKPNNKLKVAILLNKPFYTAGTELTGFIEITSLTKENLGIADITLELTGYEELEPAAAPNIAGLSKPGQFGAQLPSPTKTFYRTRLLLQDHEHPCLAVQEVAYPDAEGFWPCRKGKTSLPFLLRLAPTLPNAIITSQGKVTYYLEAIIQLKSGIFKEVANFGRRVTILERWEPAEVTVYRGRGVKGETRKRLFMGGPRHLELESELVTSLVAAGSLAYVRITVRNYTTKKVQGVRLTLLQTAGAHEGLGPNVGAEAPTRPAVEKILKDADLKFSPGEERSCMVAMEIPDLTVDLPIYISHPSSWSDPCPPLDRSPDDLPATEATPKAQNDEKQATGVESPPLPHLPEISKQWGNSVHSQSAENVQSERIDGMPVEPGSISEGTSRVNSPNGNATLPLNSSSNMTSPNLNLTQPTRPSFFRRQSPANRPSTPSEVSANEIFVGGRRYHLMDSTPAPDSSPRPLTVVDEYQIRSRPSNFPTQSRHSSYVSNEQREETFPSESHDDGNRIFLDRDAFEPFVDLQKALSRGLLGADYDAAPTTPYSQKNQTFQEDEQYQWATANQTSAKAMSHHTPEQNLSRRSTRVAIKRKSSTKVRTRKPPSPKPKLKQPSVPSSSTAPERAPEGVEAQLALLQQQMALLMASLQPNPPPALTFSPPTERTSPAPSPTIPEPPKQTPEEEPVVVKKPISQRPPKKSKKPQTLRNLHQYRAALESRQADVEDSEWI